MSEFDSATEYAQQKLARQKDLEDQAVARGRHRFDKRLETARKKGRGSTHGAAKRILVEGRPKLEEAVEFWLDEQTTGRGRRHTAVRWLQEVGCDTAAAITLKLVLDHLHEDRPYRKVATQIADRILMEARSRRLEEKAPGLFQYRVNSFQGTAHYRHMRNSMQATIRYSDIDVSDLDMTKSEKILVGTVLLDLLQQALGIIETENVVTSTPGSKYKQEKIIRVDEETREWLAKRNAKLRDYWPVLGPMVVPPLEWGPGERGGYRYALRGIERLVRGPAFNNAPNNRGLDEVYQAVNAVQETSWIINLRTLEVLEKIVERGGDRAGVPRLEKIPVPPKPHDIDTNEEAKAEWKERARRRHLRERERQAEAAVFLKTFQVARELEGEEELYWPHNLDFRGRVYPMPDVLQPQGPDLHRGLLQFAEGVPLGRDGAMWLAVHGANCIGEASGRKLDKEPLEARVEWVNQNSDRIVEVANDPLGNTWWQDADEPWQALAFCFEWRRFMRHNARGKKESEFLSYLPVHVDGSCNGLQHFAALLRDEKGGRAVNLTPEDRPMDFYTTVLDATLDNLEDIVATGDEEEALCASLWLQSGLVDRSMVKRPSMTFGYGSKQYGFRNQIEEHLRSSTDWWETRDYFTREIEGEEVDLTFKSCSVLAGAIWNAIGEEASGAARAMEWIQEATRVVAKSGRKVSWEVPVTGFRVTQGYMKAKLKQVKTVLSGKIIQPSYHENTDEPDSRKQASAAPPNIIHSLDAANLVMAVNAARQEGVTHFAVVHDSFATHAGHMTLLSRAIRSTFVQLHSLPILEDLEAQFRAQADDPDEIPEPPSRGGLDLGGVLVSRYFFS